MTGRSSPNERISAVAKCPSPRPLTKNERRLLAGSCSNLRDISGTLADLSKRLNMLETSARGILDRPPAGDEPPEFQEAVLRILVLLTGLVPSLRKHSVDVYTVAEAIDASLKAGGSTP